MSSGCFGVAPVDDEAKAGQTFVSTQTFASCGLCTSGLLAVGVRPQLLSLGLEFSCTARHFGCAWMPALSNVTKDTSEISHKRLK
eukprot:6366012-Amphidinium_carterae.1